MVLIEHDWEEIQNSYPRSLGGNISRQIWISSIIIKLWYIAWDICNFSNYNLFDTDISSKTEIIACINTRVTYHYNQGMT